MVNHPNRSRFRFVDADGRDITGTDEVVGYNVQDFFNCDVQGATEQELAAGYKGADSDGIGVRWVEMR
jgi:hypothetical protein